MGRTSLPPGFRFHPTDVELIMYHLKKKVRGKKLKFEAISELNIYKYSPWDLADKSCLRSKDLEWFFFCPKEKKYANGARTNRATETGYWKATGKDRSVSYKEQIVGMVKTLIFHKGHAPKGERTDWVMHEYRIQDKELADAGVVQDAYVICKVFQKSGPGPRNGAQYGAPFNEEDYDDDGEICAESLPSVALPPSTLLSNNSVFDPGSTSRGLLLDPGPSKSMPSADEVPSPALDNHEDIIAMLDMFTDDSFLLPIENGNNEVENFRNVNHNEGPANLDVNEIFNGLGDLDNSWAELGGGVNFSGQQTIGYGLNPMPAGNDAAFLELNDLNNPLNLPAEDMGSENFLTDSLSESYKYSYCLEQNYWPVDSFGSIQHDSTLNQSPLLPKESNGHVNHFHAFQMENGIWGNANQAFTSTSCNSNVTHRGQLEEGAQCSVQDQNRSRFC